jgi:hypothetical protein
VPVGQLDNAIIGHLWLMFASQCYWPTLTDSRLTPVYDWQASVMAGGQNRKVPAKWELLAGAGSLPKDVQYLGGWGQTNGWYHTTGTKMAGDVVVPSGFFFEENQIGAEVDPTTLTHKIVRRKRVDVTVTDVRAGCSRTNLLPLPGPVTMVMDLRVPGVDPPGSRISSPPSYANPTPGQWPTLEEAAKLAEVRRNAAAEMRQRAQDRGRPPASPPDIR